MFSFRKLCSKPLLGMASLFLLLGAAQATTIYTGTISLSASDPTQMGRLVRGGVAQDWTGGETYPGINNLDLSLHYQTIDLDLGALESSYASFGGYIQISFDSVTTYTFLSAYLGSYDPSSKSSNWLGDAGFSGNDWGVNPLFFQVQVSSGSHLILLLNETFPDAGLGLTGTVTVEAFTDTSYTDLVLVSSVPEPQTWAMLLGGLGLLPLLKRRRAAASRAAS